MGATLYPADFRISEIDEDVRPFPMPEITPPEIKMYLVRVLFLSGTIYDIKKTHKKSRICERRKGVEYIRH